MLIPAHLVLIGQMFNLILLTNANSRWDVSGKQRQWRDTPLNSLLSSHAHSKLNSTINKLYTSNSALKRAALQLKRDLHLPSPRVNPPNNRLGGKVFRENGNRIKYEQTLQRKRRKGYERRINNQKRWRSTLRRHRRTQLIPDQNSRSPDHLKFTPKITPSPAKAANSQEHKPNYQQLNSIISQMTPEAQTTLVDILVKHLAEKSQLTPNTCKQQVPPVKTHDGVAIPIVQHRQQQQARHGAVPETPDHLPTTTLFPLNVNIDKEKLQNLFSLLNSDGSRGLALPKAYESTIIRDEVRKPGKCHKCRPRPQSYHPRPSVIPKWNQVETETYDPQIYHNSNQGPTAIDGAGKLVNLTQVFNVHPKLLVVNSRVPNGRIHSKCRKPITKSKPCSKTVKEDSDKGYDAALNQAAYYLYDEDERISDGFKNEISPT